MSLIPITRQPARPRRSAEIDPTLPKPWTATVALEGFMPNSSSAFIVTVATPRPVASARPCEPPTEIGLPVMTAGIEYPSCMLTVSINQAIV